MVLNNLNRYAKSIFNQKMYFLARKYYFAVRKKKYRKYIGGERYCPCCGNHITEFIDFEYRSNHYNHQMYEEHYKNTICPVCCSLPRQRVAASYIEKEFDYLRKKEILFFAPSYAGEVCMNRLGLTWQSADLYQFADRKIDIQNMDIPDESIEVILCNHVLEHVPEFKLAIQEMYRVLKKGGILELSVPQFPNQIYTAQDGHSKEENWKLYGQADHLRIFGLDIKDTLTECGFTVTPVWGNECEEAAGCRIGPADYDIDCIYVCEK